MMNDMTINKHSVIRDTALVDRSVHRYVSFELLI